MIVSVFVRSLKAGASFEDFIEEWEADKGFGVPARVLNSVSLTDPREVLTIGFVDISVDDLQVGLEKVAAQESVRHDRIETVIESTQLKQMYELRTEHDFTDEPREIELGSIESLVHRLVLG